MSDHNGDAAFDGEAPEEQLSAAETRAMLNQVHDALLDVASGQVVGALWDEVRAMRSSLDTALGTGPRPAPEADPAGEALATMAADLAALRAELSEGLIVEPSDALAGTVDHLRAELAGLDDRIQSIADVRGEVSSLRSDLEAGIEQLRADAADAAAAVEPAAPAPPPVSEAAISEAVAAELAGELTVLRQQVDAEFDSVRQLIEGLAAQPAPEPPASAPVDLAPITELLEHVRDDLAELPSRIEIPPPPAPPAPEPQAAPQPPPAGPTYATLDPETIEVLREEMRVAGGVSEGVLEAVRNDLVALRRRIKLRAEGELFTPDQLDHIAEAVARRLAE